MWGVMVVTTSNKIDRAECSILKTIHPFGFGTIHTYVDPPSPVSRAGPRG